MLLGCYEISIYEISGFLSLKRFHDFEIDTRCSFEILCCLLHDFLIIFVDFLIRFYAFCSTLFVYDFISKFYVFVCAFFNRCEVSV
jgi:hypothetical protein